MKYDNDKVITGAMLSVCAIPVAAMPVVLFVLPKVALIAKTSPILGAAALVGAGALYCLMATSLVRLLGTARFFHVPLVSGSRIPTHALPTDDFESANDLESHRLYKASDVTRGIWDTASPFHDSYK